MVGRGWRAAQQLAAGDVLMSHEKHPVAVEAVGGGGEPARVYNVEVEGYHTYFVGSPHWGSAVWAHNAAPCVLGDGSNAPNTPKQFQGTDKPWTTGATPNSTYTHIDPKTGRAVQNAIYDQNGNVIGHVDFKNHGPGALSGHGHQFPQPGNPASGHGPGMPHIPNNQLPPGWDTLPPGVSPQKPIGQ